MNNLIKSLFIVMILSSCESGIPETVSTESKILNDSDFISMIATVHFMNTGPKETGQQFTGSDYQSIVSRYFTILNQRYTDFDLHAQNAIQNKESNEFKAFIEQLSQKISTDSQVARHMYDGASFCGNDCGSNQANAVALGCITGCYYSESYCLTHSGTGCSAMRSSCTGSCCRNYCPE